MTAVFHKPWWLSIALTAATGLGVLWMEYTRNDRIDVQRLTAVEVRQQAQQGELDHIQQQVDRLVSELLEKK